jgi:hypothetical protein
MFGWETDFETIILKISQPVNPADRYLRLISSLTVKESLLKDIY